MQLFAKLSFMVLYVPVIRMIIAPYICNSAIQVVAYQMMQSQVLFMDRVAPIFYDATPPQPTAVSMGRDLLCSGGKYFTFFSMSIILLLLYLPIICRLIASRGVLSLLRYSGQFRSGIGWWRDDDTRASLDVVHGRNHSFALKNRYIALIFLVLLRTILMALAEALLPPAAEFFFVLVCSALMHFILMIRPMFHDQLANILVKSCSAVIVLLSALGWFSAVWPRPIGPEGNSRDAFINFLVVAGSPGVFVGMLLEEKLRVLLRRHCSCCRKSVDGGSAGGGRSQRSGLQSRGSQRSGLQSRGSQKSLISHGDTATTDHSNTERSGAEPATL